MQRFVATFFAGALVLAVLAATGLYRDAGAVAPGDGGIASSLCGETAAAGTAGAAEPAATGAETGGRILLACQFQKPQNGCKKNPCDGKTYCCVNYNCKPM